MQDNGIHYAQRVPAEELRNYIECYWILRMHHSALGRQRLIPGGRIEMIINFGSALPWMVDEQNNVSGYLGNGVSVMGQRNKIFYAVFEGSLDLIGVRFKPGGLSAFTHLPAKYLLNELVEGENVFGPLINNWKQQMQSLRKDQEKFELMDSFLKSLTGRYHSVEPVIMNIINGIKLNDEPVSISAIGRQTGWNYKKLEREFLKYTGYTPKQYMRIVRFNKALRKIYTDKQSLTATGFDFGYYDQAHFIKDCIQLTGTSPGRLQCKEQAIANLLIENQPV